MNILFNSSKLRNAFKPKRIPSATFHHNHLHKPMPGYSLIVPILFLDYFYPLQIHLTSFAYQMKFLNGL